MTDDKKIVDFTNFKVTRDSIGGLEDILQQNVRGAVEHAAAMHGGMPQEWIDAKSEAAIEIFNAIIDEARKPVRVSLPADLPETTVREIQAAVNAWGADHLQACLAAFADGFVKLLGPEER